MFDQYTGSVTELGWRFQHAEPAIGVRAQSYADGGSGRVFDSAEEDADDFYIPTASARAHLGKRTNRHRWAVNRLAKVDATLAELAGVPGANDEPFPHAQLLKRAFSPAGRASPALAKKFTVFDDGRGPGVGITVCLLAIAVDTPAAREAFYADDKDRRPEDTVSSWLERVRLRKDSVLDHLSRVAQIAVLPSLAAYHEARERRIGAEKIVRGLHEAELAAYREEKRLEREAKDRARFERQLGSVHATQHEALRARVAMTG